jgi:hypothetical protein
VQFSKNKVSDELQLRCVMQSRYLYRNRVRIETAQMEPGNTHTHTQTLTESIQPPRRHSAGPDRRTRMRSNRTHRTRRSFSCRAASHLRRIAVFLRRTPCVADVLGQERTRMERRGSPMRAPTAQRGDETLLVSSRRLNLLYKL